MLELWGGHECTVNRVGDRIFDQTVRTGHEVRADDLDRFADLGLKALRYPVLWERTAPDANQACDWRWSDDRLKRISTLGMRPIVGLLHHGAGPHYTHLLDRDFPNLFGAYARAVAERYPWVEAWTPINEPLTTARFSALYGLWHPHRTDEPSFWLALINQIEAISQAMREIRVVNRKAQLIQTEDLGRTYGTRAVAHQADFDNTRRWMTWDLLCGRVTPHHPLWSRLETFGLGDRLRALMDVPCPPDILGVNHYLTSDRFLDHRPSDYPPQHQGGNKFMAFADVEAIRVTVPAPAGLEGALDEAWARYALPLAVTECQNACTREEQVRWLREAWETAQRLRTRQVDVRAVTAWALLGAYDWSHLLTEAHGRYEPGAFDISGPTPRPTALAAEIRRLARGGGEIHPTTEGPGWWRRDIRLTHRPVYRSHETPEPRRSWRWSEGTQQPLLITGATGTLGRAFARACEWRGIAYHLASRAELSLDSEESIANALGAMEPWAVVNTAGWVRVDEAEHQREACYAANALGAVRLARACSDRGLRFVGFSSDLVFNGAKGSPYTERDVPAPLNVYGASKVEAERDILVPGANALIVRSAAFFSPYDPHNFAADVLRTLSDGRTLEAADVVVSPTYVPDLVNVTLDLLIDGEIGLRHLVNAGSVSWADFARRLARALGLDERLIVDVPAAQLNWIAVRPSNAALTSDFGVAMPSLDSAVERYAATIRSAELALEAAATSPGPIDTSTSTLSATRPKNG